MQKYNKAKLDFDKSRKLGDKNGWLYRNLSCYYLKYKKDKSKAIEYLKTAAQAEYPYKDYEDFKSESCFNSIKNDEKVQTLFQIKEG
jgi:hypothetical protein